MQYNLTTTVIKEKRNEGKLYTKSVTPKREFAELWEIQLKLFFRFTKNHYILFNICLKTIYITVCYSCCKIFLFSYFFFVINVKYTCVPSPAIHPFSVLSLSLNHMLTCTLVCCCWFVCIQYVRNVRVGWRSWLLLLTGCLRLLKCCL